MKTTECLLIESLPMTLRELNGPQKAAEEDEDNEGTEHESDE